MVTLCGLCCLFVGVSQRNSAICEILKNIPLNFGHSGGQWPSTMSDSRSLKYRIFGTYFGGATEEEKPHVKVARLRAEVAQLELQIISSSEDGTGDIDKDECEAEDHHGFMDESSLKKNAQNEGIFQHIVRMVKSDGGGVDIDHDPEYNGKNDEEEEEEDEAYNQLVRYGEEDDEDHRGMNANFPCSTYISGCALALAVLILLLIYFQQYQEAHHEDDDRPAWDPH
jgi:hypothetical protein